MGERGPKMGSLLWGWGGGQGGSIMQTGVGRGGKGGAILGSPRTFGVTLSPLPAPKTRCVPSPPTPSPNDGVLTEGAQLQHTQEVAGGQPTPPIPRGQDHSIGRTEEGDPIWGGGLRGHHWDPPPHTHTHILGVPSAPQWGPHSPASARGPSMMMAMSESERIPGRGGEDGIGGGAIGGRGWGAGIRGI